MTDTIRALFSPGLFTFTIGALDMGVNLFEYMGRHLSGDWGDLDPDDKRANDKALAFGGRLFSAYSTPAGRLWIITEADRSSTTCLLPDEY